MPLVPGEAKTARRSRAAMGMGIVGSLLAHGLVLVAAARYGAWCSEPAARQVVVAKLVRLGPAKQEHLLPEKAAPEVAAPVAVDESPASPPPVAPPAPPPAVPAPQPAKPRVAKPPAVPRQALAAALARTKRRQLGQANGSVDGDAERQEAGEAYAAELYRCVKHNYVIEGIEAARVAGRRAVVLVHVQADGRIVRHRITSSSGLPAFDRSVDRAVKRCGRLSPPPPALAVSLRREGLEIEFVP